MLPQKALQLFLQCLSTREETIFLLRIISHQIFCDGAVTANHRNTVRLLSEEIMKGEWKRERLEDIVTQHLGEGIRKLTLKIAQKASKVQGYYQSKTQIYFPRYGQMLAQEYVQTNQNLKNGVSILINDPNYTTAMILKYISNQQKQKLKSELNKLQSFNLQYQLLFDKNDRCNRNEKLFSDPLLYGVQGAKYLNDIHERYFMHDPVKNNKQVYDILPIDDQSKQLIYNGSGSYYAIQIMNSGFKSFISSICAVKQDKGTDSIYIPLESTQEIITQRYEKFLKEMQDNNFYIAKNLQRYNDQYCKHLERKKNKLKNSSSNQNSLSQISLNMVYFSKLQCKQHRQPSSQNVLKKVTLIRQPNTSTNKNSQSISQLPLKSEGNPLREDSIQVYSKQSQKKSELQTTIKNSNPFQEEKYPSEINTDKDRYERKELVNPEQVTYNSEYHGIVDLQKSIQMKQNSPKINGKKLVRIKQLPSQIKRQSQQEGGIQQTSVGSYVVPNLQLPPHYLAMMSNFQVPPEMWELRNREATRQIIQSPKSLCPAIQEMAEQYTLNGRAINKLSIVSLPYEKGDAQQPSRKKRVSQIAKSQELDSLKSQSRAAVNNVFRIKNIDTPNQNSMIYNQGVWSNYTQGKVQVLNYSGGVPNVKNRY